MQITVTVNGGAHTREVEPRLLLIHFLRDELGLTGSHWGCDTSNCGSCVVWLDARPVKACTVLAAMADGHIVRTVEGLERDGQLDPVQQGFVECHGLQCGFCTPGMMCGAVLRSPHPQARIVSVDTVAAEAHPKVKAVLTGESLAGRDLAWMPTLSGDKQAVLATDKVRFQGQEVAFVVAEDHYAARDALELIDVEYEPLPPVVDARRALDPGAPLVRDDHPGRADNHIFDWEAGDAERTDAVFRAAEVTVSQDMLYPR